MSWKRTCMLFIIVSALSICLCASAELFSATVPGFGGDVTVTVEVDNDAIVDVKCVGDGETAGVGAVAVANMPASMLSEGTWDIDGITGATVSSSAIRQAAREAMVNAGIVEAELPAVQMKAGTYTAKTYGFAISEPITVTAILSHNKIIDLIVDEVNTTESAPIIKTVAEKLIPRIIENQSVRVDSITGATMTSAGVKSAVESCLMQAIEAGECDPNAIQAFYKVPEKTGGRKRLSAQVLVIGMGGSGMMTAMSAAENGLDVLAIEKTARYGGTTGLTSEIMAVNPPRIQQEYNEGKDWVDVEAMRSDWIAFTQGDAKEEMIDLMMTQSGSAIDWLHYEHNFEFDYTPKTGFAKTDYHPVKYQFLPNRLGANKAYISAYFDGIVRDFENAGGKYMLETEAEDLIVDKNGTVIGVKAVDLVDGVRYDIYADAVVLATGGFGGNAEMEEKYLSNEYYELKGAWKQYGMTTNDGKMIQSAIDNNAGTYNIGMPPIVHVAGTTVFLPGYELNYTGLLSGLRTGRPEVWSSGDIPHNMVIASNSLAVDPHGKRFTDEAELALLNSWIAGPRFYSIWSGEQIDSLRDNGFKYTSNGLGSIYYMGYQGPIPIETPLPNAYEVLDDAIKHGSAFKADTLDELAGYIGCDPETLINTVDSYNSCAKNGVDEQFGKEAQYLDSIEQGPYYALVGAPYCYSTCGALDVNTKFQVLQAGSDVPINGLYAVGTDCMGVLFSERKPYVTYGGAANGWALTSGKLCGDYLAEELQR